MIAVHRQRQPVAADQLQPRRRADRHRQVKSNWHVAPSVSRSPGRSTVRGTGWPFTSTSRAGLQHVPLAVAEDSRRAAGRRPRTADVHRAVVDRLAERHPRAEADQVPADAVDPQQEPLRQRGRRGRRGAAPERLDRAFDGRASGGAADLRDGEHGPPAAAPLRSWTSLSAAVGRYGAVWCCSGWMAAHARARTARASRWSGAAAITSSAHCQRSRHRRASDSSLRWPTADPEPLVPGVQVRQEPVHARRSGSAGRRPCTSPGSPGPARNSPRSACSAADTHSRAVSARVSSSAERAERSPSRAAVSTTWSGLPASSAARQTARPRRVRVWRSWMAADSPVLSASAARRSAQAASALSAPEVLLAAGEVGAGDLAHQPDRLAVALGDERVEQPLGLVRPAGAEGFAGLSEGQPGGQRHGHEPGSKGAGRRRGRLYQIDAGRVSPSPWERESAEPHRLVPPPWGGGRGGGGAHRSMPSPTRRAAPHPNPPPRGGEQKARRSLALPRATPRASAGT